jgi:DNA-binding protein YbaB
VTRPTPEEWLANFNAQIADLQARTAEFQENLEQSGVTESAPDGSISVSVAPNGSLTDLRIEESAWRGNGADLAARIMRLARSAQRTAAANVAEAFAPLGADTEAMHMITGYLPPPEPDETGPRGGYSFVEEQDPSAPSSQEEPPEREPQRRPARPPRRNDDDEDFGTSIFDDDNR